MSRLGFAVWIAVLVAGVTAIASDDQVTLVGLDGDGNSVEVVVDGKDYSDRLKAVSAAVTDSAITALGRGKHKAQPWELKTVVVGVGVGIEAGLGPIISMKAVPSFKLAFSNDQDVIIP